MHKRSFHYGFMISLVMVTSIINSDAQEIQARITVMAPNVTATAADKKIFQTLQKPIEGLQSSRSC